MPRDDDVRRVLIDTSAWIETLRKAGDEDIRAAVSAATAGDTAAVCDMVLLELWNGAAEEDRPTVRALQERVECVPTTEEVWRRARRLAHGLRRRGITVPATDILIAACTREHGLDLLHRDVHFDHIAELPDAEDS